MALELIAGSVFTVLYDRVSRAVQNISEFRFLLTHMKRTLESLKGQARFIQEIREFNDELSLPNQDVGDLETQMIQGLELVGRMSSFRIYNYCCLGGCHDQLYELNTSLERLLDNLQLQQARDVKEILKLSRKNHDDLDEMKGLLKLILQKIDDPEMKGILKKLLEQNPKDNPTSASGSSTEREGSDQTQEESSEGLLEEAFQILFDVVVEVKDKSPLMLRPLIRHLKSTLDSLKPLIEDLSQQNNKTLDHPKEELETLRMHMTNGVELVRKCSKFDLWTNIEMYKYTGQLFELDECLQMRVCALIAQVAIDVKETSVMLRNVREVVKKFVGISTSGGPKNVPTESDVTEANETLASASNMEAELTKGEAEMSDQESSFKVESQSSDQRPGKGKISKLELGKDDLSIVDLAGESHKMKRVVKAKDRELMILGALREFSYRELKKATNNFDVKNKLMSYDTYITAYRGLLSKENILVTIKIQETSNNEGKDEQLAKLTVINQLSHKHIVRLLGWCYQKKKVITVHDYMENGSLLEHLFSGQECATTLEWSMRYNIISGVASALHYLHNEFEFKVLHKDIKPANIMLDSEFNARLGGIDLRSYSHEGLMGTVGYIAPDCMLTGKLTRKSDVYSFGVMLLEVVCGQRSFSMMPEGLLINRILSLHEQGRLLDAVDERLQYEYDEEQAHRLLLLGLACSHPNRQQRPKIQTIVQVISGSIPVPEIPPFSPNYISQDDDSQMSHFEMTGHSTPEDPAATPVADDFTTIDPAVMPIHTGW